MGNNVQQARPYEPQNYFNNPPIPHVHDYFNPYPNQHPYQPFPIIPPTTYVHYPTYQTHPLNTSPIVHHVANMPPSPSHSLTQQAQITSHTIPQDQQVEQVSKKTSNNQKQKQVSIEEEPLPRPSEHDEEEPKAMAWSTSMTNPKKKKAETPKKEKKPIVKPLQKQRHASVPPKFG